MRIATNGMVTNEYGQILLMQRNDTRTWAPPGGHMDPDELPDACTAREVREETGLIVMPVRLTGLYYWTAPADPMLVFAFRCIQRGGEIETSLESPQVGFAKSNNLPRTMLPLHRRRVVDALNHTGGPPVWGRQETGLPMRLGWAFLNRVIYRWYDFRRKRRGQPLYEPPPPWRVSAYTLIRKEGGKNLWFKDAKAGEWRLPGGATNNEPPWETAVHLTQSQTGLTVRLTDLSGVYMGQDEGHLHLFFTAEVERGRLTSRSSQVSGFAYARHGREPAGAHPLHAAAARSDSPETDFRHIEAEREETS